MSKFRPIILMAGALAALALTLTLTAGAQVQAQTDRLCFNQTGFCIEGRIREYWEQNGGLPVFGFPTTVQREEDVEGKKFQVQWFERNRLELHPENARPYDVLLGRLGDMRLLQQNRNWTTFAKLTAAPPGCQYFAETGHSLCEPFLSYFRANGLEVDGQPGKSLRDNIALFGFPLSEPTVETNQAGATVNTQWFERARFEHHPANPPQFQVLLGLLGNEIRNHAPPAPLPTLAPTLTATPTPTPSACSKVPEPVSATIAPAKCIRAGTQITLDIFGFRPNEQIGYWLTGPDGTIVAGTEQTYAVSAAGTGRLVDNTGDLDPGVWSWVFEGVASKHQAIVYFLIE